MVLRQEHRPGEKLCVDWAGATIPLYDSQTGEIHQAPLFVAVLGARGRRLFCTVLCCEADDRRIPSGNCLGDEKARVGSSICDRLCDFGARPGRLSPSTSSVGMDEAASPVFVAVAVTLSPEIG